MQKFELIKSAYIWSRIKYISLKIFLYSILNVLEDVIPIKKNDNIESISKLEQTQKLISSSNLNEKNPSLSLANWIKNIPIIYYPWGLQAAANAIKSKIDPSPVKPIEFIKKRLK